MKYLEHTKYIIVLLLLISGMFYFGKNLEAQPELTYSSTPDAPLSSTYTKKDYCADEIDEEIVKYEAELNAAYIRISQLNKKLTQAESATLSADASVEVKPEEGKESL